MHPHHLTQFSAKLCITLVAGWIFSSCTIALPEFQTAESLAPQQHKVAAGGYSGRGLNASTGGLLVHNYGITERLDLTSNMSLSRLNIEQNNIRYSLLSGPKLSNASGSWALSAPVGAIYTETYNDIDAGFTYLFTPTVYKSWKFANPDLTYTFFARSEFAYNYIRGRWFTVVGGTATATKWSALFIIFHYPEAQTALFMGSTLGTEFH